MIEVFNIKQGHFFGILNLKAFASKNNLTAKRSIELEGKQFLLDVLLGNTSQIYYDEKGKPHLVDNSNHISISHSHDKLAIMVNEKEPTGIDIELIREKVLKIKHKFLSESELLNANNDIEKLVMYWAAKETLYKIYGLKGVDFIEHLFINPFTKSNLGTIIGEVGLPNFKEQFALNYQIIDNYVLVYALKKL